MKIMHNIRVDLTRRENIPQIYVSQNDSQSRYVKAFLFDGAVPFLVPDGVSASFAFKKPDRTGGWYDEMPDGSVAASAEGNQITIALTDEIFQVAGKVSASIVLRNGNLEQLAVFPFAINVVENPAADRQISNSYYKIRSLADLNLVMDEKMDKGKADRPLDMAGNSIFNVGGSIEIVQPGDNEGILVSAKREISENGGLKEASIRFEETTADGAVTLKNVADGAEDSDAATVGQLAVKKVKNTGGETVYLRDLESGAYTLEGSFQLYPGSARGAFSSPVYASISKQKDYSEIQIFSPLSNIVRYMKVYDDSVEVTVAKLNDMESVDNRVTELDHNSDDSHYPTAKAVYTALGGYTDEKYFDIDLDGIVFLKPEYRGAGSEPYQYSISDNGAGVAGSLNNELPEKIVIPDVIDGTAVSGFKVAAFSSNLRLKEVTIPESVKSLPDRLFAGALNVKAVHNTENVEKLGGSVFTNTQIEKAIFPNLKEAAPGAFAAAYFMYFVDIGNNLTTIANNLFRNCLRLSLVRGGLNVKTIEPYAFYLTSNLKNLELLKPTITSIGNFAFYQSRIQYDWSQLINCTFGKQAYPTQDNTIDYWTDVQTTPCENEIVTIFSQMNAAWADQEIPYVSWTLNGAPTKYINACHTFCIMHIYSALTGIKFTHPDEFIELIYNLNAPSGTDWMSNENVPGLNNSEKVGLLFSDLGFKVTEYRNTGNSITKDEYQALCDALARGAYVYTQTATANDPGTGHVVIAYGINEAGELLFLRPENVAELCRPAVNIDSLQLYRMPYPNMSSPYSNFIIVEKKEE